VLCPLRDTCRKIDPLDRDRESAREIDLDKRSLHRFASATHVEGNVDAGCEVLEHSFRSPTDD
jgi:hypothetical protein